MKTVDNVHTLVRWLSEHQPATVAHVVAVCLRDSRDASNAIQWAMRHGVLEKVKRPGSRVHYLLTGKALPINKPNLAPSFDELLQAWGIALKPPQLTVCAVRKIEFVDGEQVSGSDDFARQIASSDG